MDKAIKSGAEIVGNLSDGHAPLIRETEGAILYPQGVTIGLLIELGFANTIRRSFEEPLNLDSAWKDQPPP